ncbi:MAG: hypothetical protein KJ906_02190 [Nanoarchaeota archaeon]|nr:hypothetical protein [Nanoarchaeota archaeon]
MKYGQSYGPKEMVNELSKAGITNFIIAPFDKGGNELECGETVIQYEHFSAEEFINKYQERIDTGIEDSLTLFFKKELERTGEKNLQDYVISDESKIEIAPGNSAILISDYPEQRMKKVYADEQATREHVESVEENAELFFTSENFRLFWPLYNKDKVD